MEKHKTGIKKSTSDELSRVLSELSADQIRFVVARQEFSTDSEAAEAIGIKPNTVYNWPKNVKEAVRLMAADGLTTAMHIRRRNLAKAMLIKASGLNSKDERIRQSASTEIIEWELGKATQRQELGNADDNPFAIKFVWDDNAPDTAE